MLAPIQPDLDETPAKSHARRMVLLVDDCDDTRALYAEYLELAGFDVKEAADGLSALAKAASSIPDMIVMDLGLPGMTGRETAERFKDDPRTRGVPVIVVSGFQREAMEQGRVPWDGYIAKPCLPDELVEAIERLLSAS
jgi:CheY-like chemotaxis protein